MVPTDSIFPVTINPMELQHQRSPGDNAFRLTPKQNRHFKTTVPEPLGWKSIPTTLSNNEDLPELCRSYQQSPNVRKRLSATGLEMEMS
jgi:hypothetical protein